MTPAQLEDDEMLNALLDGELDAASASALERRLAADAALAGRFALLTALHGAVSNALPQERAPDALHAGIAALAAPPAGRAPPQPHGGAPWRAMAATLILGAILGAGAMRLTPPSVVDDPIERDAVAGYLRGRISGAAIDVVSSERHTVKPWLATKIAASTTVPDLGADGFPLAGGRVDIIAGVPAATLIYQRREHMIALTELPGGAIGPSTSARDGFALLRWSDASRNYVAVSDLPPSELETFAAAFKKFAEKEK